MSSHQRVRVTPDHNLALDLVRATEAAALSAAAWIGRGDQIGADQAAVDAMRLLFNTVPFDGVVVIGEGEKDEAPMLYNGEHLGAGTPPSVDVAVDPIDGTRLTARGEGNAISVVAASERGTMFDPGPCFYMEKLVVGREGADVIDLDAPIEDNVRKLAKAKGMQVGDLTVLVIDRERHNEAVARVRSIGARVHLIPDGDVAGAVAAATRGTGVDMLYSIGGTPEGVIAAAALKCVGGEIQGRLRPRSEEERKATLDAGYDLEKILRTEDLIKGDNVFFAATGVTDGSLLQGVRYNIEGATTESIVMRSKSGTIRRITAEHRWEALGPVRSGELAPPRSADHPVNRVPPSLKPNGREAQSP